MQDAWRAYLQLALGLTEASKKQAQKVAKKLVGTSGATAAQLQGFAEEMLSTGAANREALTKLVRFEVERALGKVGLATTEEVSDLTKRVHQLEQELREARAAAASVAAAGGAAVVSGEQRKPATPSAAGRAAVRGEHGDAAVPSAADRTVAKPAQKAVAKKAVAKKAVAKQTAQQAVAKRAAAKGTGKQPPTTGGPV